MLRNYRKVRKNKKYYKKRMNKKKYQPKKHFFSETFQATPLNINQSGLSGSVSGQFHTAAIDSMPTTQLNAYKELYRKYRIRKLEWIMIPRFAQAEPNQAELNVGTGFVGDDNVVFHYRKAWASNPAKPLSEIDMLQNNGVKSRRLNGTQPIRISMWNPIVQEQYATVQPGGGSSQTAVVKNRWCSFDDAIAPAHGGLLTYTRSNSSGIFQDVGQACAQVYCKIYFEVADPR